MLNYLQNVLCKLFYIISAIVVLNPSYLQQQNGVDAELVISPLWDIRVNKSERCDIHYSGEGRNATTTLTGYTSDLCSLQITGTGESAILIQIPQRLSESDYLYFERLGADCPTKIIRIDGQDEPCSVIVIDKQVQLNLRSNVSLLISEISQYDQAKCTSYEDVQNSVGRQTTPVCRMKEYSDVYSCTLKDWGINHDICEIKFPPNCIGTLAYRETTFQCSDVNQNKRSMMFYPYKTSHLHLNKTNTMNYDINAFKGLRRIQRLYLGYNQIRRLSSGLLYELNNVKYIQLVWNELAFLDASLFEGMFSLDGLSLKGNSLTTLPADIFQTVKKLNRIKLDYNHLEVLDGGTFRNLPNLTRLDFRHNWLARLHVNLFQGLRNLDLLLLTHNYLNHLDPHIFQDLMRLTSLSLGYNKLLHLDSGLFEKTVLLSLLDLSHNRLHRIPRINHLLFMNQLHLEGIMLEIANKHDFSRLLPMSQIYVSQPEICVCYAPINVNCSTSEPRSPYLTCDRLLSDRVLLVIMWLIGLSAIGGNIFVLWWRNTMHKSKYKIQSRLVLNLALSDLLMGVYMIIIASADIYFGEYFPVHAETWRTGITCRIAGILSVLSSEASVFFVTLISIDRFITIKYPHTAYKFGHKSIVVALLLIWTFAGILGIIPAILSGKNTDFYDNSHVCIGIPLALVTSYSTHNFDRTIKFGHNSFFLEKTFSRTQLIGSEPGMYFATAVFIGLNSLCYLTILVCYTELLRVIYKVSKRDGLNQEMREQLRLTAKVTAIVVTDFLCWCPIIVLGILVQIEAISLPPSVFAWSVTVILPLNSAINPFLYTIADLFNKRHKQTNKTVSSRQTNGDTQQVPNSEVIIDEHYGIELSPVT